MYYIIISCDTSLYIIFTYYKLYHHVIYIIFTLFFLFLNFKFVTNVQRFAVKSLEIDYENEQFDHVTCDSRNLESQFHSETIHT